MTLFKKIVFIITVLILVYSTMYYCTSRQKSSDAQEIAKNINFKNSFSLKPISDKTFMMDSLTSSEKIWTYFYQGKKKVKKLYILSYLDQSLQAYDWNKGTLLYKKKLPVEGPDGVGRPFSMVVASEDSIYVLSPYDYKVTLIDSIGHVRRTYSLFNGIETIPALGNGVLPLSNSSSQIALIGTKLVVGGSPNDDCKKESFYTNGKVGISLNLTNGKVDYLINMPSVFLERYKSGFALSGQQSFFGQTHNAEKNTAIINFPTENDLYEIDINSKKINRHYAGSKQFKAVEYGKKDLVDIHKEFEYWARQPEFPAVYYDSYRKIYIRIVANPNFEKSNIYDSNDGKPLFKLSVILLDQNFVKVGEHKLGSNYWEAKAFITPEGIFLLKHTDDETKLVYTLHSITPTNEVVN